MSDPKAVRTQRRGVIISERNPKVGRPRLWAFGYPDLAALFGMSDGGVRMAVARKQLDPTDLASIVKFYNERNNKSLDLFADPGLDPSDP
jgi:hypothetical protein